MKTSLLMLHATQQEGVSILKSNLKGKSLVPSGFGIMNWMNNTDSDYPWRNTDGTIKAIDINSLQSVNGV